MERRGVEEGLYLLGAYVRSAKTLKPSTCAPILGAPKLPPVRLCSSLHLPGPSPSSVAGAATREPLSVEFAPICVTKRDFALSLTAALFLPLAGNAAILEADDDEELLERVKKDRQKRIERQGVINSSKQETGREPGSAPVATGSHIDAIPYSGKYDGVVGVLGAIQAIDVLDRGERIELLVDKTENLQFQSGHLEKRFKDKSHCNNLKGPFSLYVRKQKTT
ncbi:hypothetical protein V2J09_006921 [Rumex salicifolius]